MTLREIIDNSGSAKGCPMDLKDLEVRDGEEISKKVLFDYFESSKFQNDVLSVMDKIHIAKDEGYDTFSLFFDSSEETPLSLKVSYHNL